jgi:hypothetical protein
MTKRSPPPATYAEIAHSTVPAWEMFRGEHESIPVLERELAERVRAAFAAEVRLAHQAIAVAARGSRIQLTGIVVGPGTSAYAEDVAKSVDGVMGVDNELTIEQ